LIIPKVIAESAIVLSDQYFDLKGLSLYSALAVPTLRDYIREGALPYFKLKGKVLVRKSEFDTWLEKFRVDRKKDLNTIANEIVHSVKKRRIGQAI